jgi:hypothetical protein
VFYSLANVEFRPDSSIVGSQTGRYMLLAKVQVTEFLSLLVVALLKSTYDFCTDFTYDAFITHSLKVS